MKSAWIAAAGLLALTALAIVAVVVRVDLMARRADAAMPEPTVASAPVPMSTAPSAGVGGLPADTWERLSDTGDVGLVAGDTGFSLLTRLADVLQIPLDELRAAIDDGETLAQIATANGMSRQGLIDALLAEELARLALAAQTGILSHAQVDFFQDWLIDAVELLIDHPLPISPAWLGVFAQDWEALFDAADYDLPDRLAGLLGLPLEDLGRALFDGQSLAEIARAHGVDPQAVLQFLVAEASAELDEGLAAGYLTPEQATILLGWVEGALVRVMENSFAVPDAAQLLELLQSLFGSCFQDTLLGELDWGKWLTFDWAQFVGRDPLSVTADRIGISRGALLEAFARGQSLSEIAAAHGIDVQVLDDARIASVNAILDDLVRQGLIPVRDLNRFTQVVGPGVWRVVERDFSFKFVIKGIIRYADDSCACLRTVPFPSAILPATCGVIDTLQSLIGSP
jgi:uncharacterized protein YidB (DUF937 family)